MATQRIEKLKENLRYWEHQVELVTNNLAITESRRTDAVWSLVAALEDVT